MRLEFLVKKIFGEPLRHKKEDTHDYVIQKEEVYNFLRGQDKENLSNFSGNLLEYMKKEGCNTTLVIIKGLAEALFNRKNNPEYSSYYRYEDMKDIDLQLLAVDEESAKMMNKNAIRFLLENYGSVLVKLKSDRKSFIINFKPKYIHLNLRYPWDKLADEWINGIIDYNKKGSHKIPLCILYHKDT